MILILDLLYFKQKISIQLTSSLKINKNQNMKWCFFYENKDVLLDLTKRTETKKLIAITKVFVNKLISRVTRFEIQNLTTNNYIL